MADKGPDFAQDKRTALLSIRSTDGYQVILDIMEDVCNKAENEFIGANPADKELVLSKHAIMHAQRIFFQTVVAKIDLLCEEQTGVAQPNPRLVKFAQLLSALPITEDLN